MKKCLLLSAYYIPTRIIDWQSAVTMWAKGTVDVIAEYAETISSPSVTIRLPAVLRLKRPPPGKKKAVKFSRIGIYTRDNWTCQYCGRRCSFGELTYDHITPRSKAGRTDWLNICAACGPCNAKKGNRTCDEAGMWPMREPFVPKSLPNTPPPLDCQKMEPEWAGWFESSK